MRRRAILPFPALFLKHMTSAIGKKFSELKKRDRAALVCYLTAGDPSLEMTEKIAAEIAAAGADILEIGIPFSDPMADGPVIQRACERALESGTTLEKVLQTVRNIRENSDIPILLFGYSNPFLTYGSKRLASDSKAAGADGILAVDLPPEEAAEFSIRLKENGMDQVFLLSPNTNDDRIAAVRDVAGGFIYLVSITGVTGARPDMDYAGGDSLSPLVGKIRESTGLPVGVGFGISTPAQAGKVASFADAVIVGSAIMKIVEENPSSAPEKIGQFVSSLSGACERGGAN